MCVHNESHQVRSVCVLVVAHIKDSKSSYSRDLRFRLQDGNRSNAKITFHIAAKMLFSQLKNLSNAVVPS